MLYVVFCCKLCPHHCSSYIGMQMCGDSTSLNGHKIATDAIKYRLKDGYSIEFADCTVQDKASEAANRHGNKYRSPPRVQD